MQIQTKTHINNTINNNLQTTILKIIFSTSKNILQIFVKLDADVSLYYVIKTYINITQVKFNFDEINYNRI